MQLPFFGTVTVSSPSSPDDESHGGTATKLLAPEFYTFDTCAASIRSLSGSHHRTILFATVGRCVCQQLFRTNFARDRALVRLSDQPI